MIVQIYWKKEIFALLEKQYADWRMNDLNVIQCDSK